MTDSCVGYSDSVELNTLMTCCCSEQTYRCVVDNNNTCTCTCVYQGAEPVADLHAPVAGGAPPGVNVMHQQG